MARGFYFKLALNNIKRNKKSSIPYFIAATIMISVYFMILNIIFNPGLSNVPEGAVLQTLFTIGIVVLTVFVTIFMIYINSFLIKQRKREFGLYGILGLEKRHVGRVMLWENLCINGAALVLGMASACVFGWLIFLLLMKCIRVTSNSYFTIPIEPFLLTTAVFLCIFVVISILNLLQIRIANPIDLLKSNHMGEKKVRFVIPMTILGLLGLGWAYYTSWSVKNALTALNLFFIAVLVVILASYALFTTGSIAFLRILKKNKKFYYKSENFISIGGMFHRMKQNASGLASICILSTMVLVTVSTCVSLFLGQENSLKMTNQDDIKIKVSPTVTKEQIDLLENEIVDLADKNKVQIENQYYYFSMEEMMIYKDKTFSAVEFDMASFDKLLQDTVDVKVLTLEDYNRNQNTSIELDDNQILLLGETKYEGITEITLKDQRYEITTLVTDAIFTHGKNRDAFQEVFMVTKDLDAAKRFIQQIGDSENGGSTKYILNINGKEEDCYNFVKDLRDSYDEIFEIRYGISDIYTDRAAGYSIYGGLLFMGAFFTILFLCTTVLIIYYKQISEGYDDKERFETLQKVGMDDLEVKRTINKQILIVFFLPLIGALLHLTMASNMIIKMLEIFWLHDTKITILCMVSSCAIFTTAYIFVYRLTAKTYYNIVKW